MPKAKIEFLQASWLDIDRISDFYLDVYKRQPERWTAPSGEGCEHAEHGEPPHPGSAGDRLLDTELRGSPMEVWDLSLIHILTDLINLTFCCQQATVITDFSDLEQIGRDHYIDVYKRQEGIISQK